MYLRSLVYLKFLCTSTNQHGVHSPFVYRYITECLYKKEGLRTRKSIQILLKSATYFQCNNLLIQGKDKRVIPMLSGKLPTAIFNTPPYDLIFKPVNEWQTKGEISLDSKRIHNNTVIILTDISKTRDSRALWKAIADVPQITVSIDMYYCGVLFVRKEQRKEHFKVRI